MEQTGMECSTRELESMNISIDKNIPLLPDILKKYFNSKTFSGRELKNYDLKETDVLFVRSTTKVNESLLRKTPVKLVGTATSGTEHIDTDYLKKKGIQFGDAKGCNANSVAEYVVYSILKWHFEYGNVLENKTIGIIGFGNIGKLVAKYSRLVGLNILINDEPLNDDGYEYPDFVEHCDYKTVFKKSDIITNHIPLTYDGKYATENLINNDLLSLMKNDVLFIHLSRGKIVNEKDFLKICEKKNITPVIDVWEDEPDFNTELLNKCMLASAHTAGYSRDGKLRGVKAMLDLLNEFTGSKITDEVLDAELSEYEPLEKDKYNDLELIYNILRDKRNFEYDFKMMKEIANLPNNERNQQFDLIRKNYPERRESL